MAITFCVFLKGIPTKPLEQSFKSDEQQFADWLYILFFYLPTGLISVLSVVMGIHFLIITFPNYRKDFGRSFFTRLVRQNSRVLHLYSQRMFYRKCVWIFIIIFCTWILNFSLFLISTYQREGNYHLFALSVMVDIMGVLFAVLFFDKEIREYCYNRNREINRDLRNIDEQYTIFQKEQRNRDLNMD